MQQLRLILSSLPSDMVQGIYKVGKDTSAMPDRMRYLAPDAAASYLDFIADVVVISDMFRSPESSLLAVRERRGAQPPAFSAHNYGLAIDIDIAATRKNLATLLGKKTVTKPELDAWMRTHGWYCHRVDGKLEIEAWHYNFLGKGVEISRKVSSTAGYVEAEIKKRYGNALYMGDLTHVQQVLQYLRVYSGAIDGIWGKLSTEALRAEQRRWGLVVQNAKGQFVPRKAGLGITYGKPDKYTMRTLNYVVNLTQVVPAVHPTVTDEATTSSDTSQPDTSPASADLDSDGDPQVNGTDATTEEETQS